MQSITKDVPDYECPSCGEELPQDEVNKIHLDIITDKTKLVSGLIADCHSCGAELILNFKVVISC